MLKNTIARKNLSLQISSFLCWFKQSWKFFSSFFRSVEYTRRYLSLFSLEILESFTTFLVAFCLAGLYNFNSSASVVWHKTYAAFADVQINNNFTQRSVFLKLGYSLCLFFLGQVSEHRCLKINSISTNYVCRNMPKSC